MIVNYEFLDVESIENVITSMHFKVDKTVFFGYHDVIKMKKDLTEAFLKKYCDVSKVTFCPLSHKRIESILEIMRVNINRELNEGNDVYFDITGGEELILVAFGILSKEYNLPVHMYDVRKNQLIEFDTANLGKISDGVPKREVTPTFDILIEMQGCAINYDLTNQYGGLGGSFPSDAESLYSIAYDYKTVWTNFITFLRKNMFPDSTLEIYRSISSVESALDSHEFSVNGLDKSLFKTIFSRLSSAGIIIDYVCSDTDFSFKYKNKELTDFMLKEGSALEYHYMKLMKSQYADALSCVMIDWDGVIHEDISADVRNEIDILALDDISLLFISCKCGKLDGSKALSTLYELDIVARRCGGKYAKKKLVTMYDIKDIYKERAKEMGIEVILVN